MKTDRRPSSGGVPNVAVLLTWFVPGAGHVYLGKIGFGVLAFLVVEGLYFAGLQLSNGMFLEYLPAEMRGKMAAVLTPEFGNLGGLLFQMREYGYGPGHPRAWPALMDVGTTLTATSGMLNLLLMSRAHLDARAPGRARGGIVDAPSAALATWIIPGLGQYLQGRKLRGLVIFVALVGLFLLGSALADGSNLDRERHFYYWAGQFLLGAPAIAAEFVHGHARMTSAVPYADAGVVLACVAGMLNVMAMLDAYTVSARRQLESPGARGGLRAEANA